MIKLYLLLLSLLLSCSAFAQIPISGKVVAAENKEGLPGASILVKGTGQGTITEVDGSFALEIPSKEAVLVFSYIGYQEQEVQVGNQTNLVVELSLDAESLEEVVVVGYATATKRDLTGSVAVLREKELREMPVTRVEQALQGRVAGVQVVQSSGEPGAGVNLRIRGFNSLRGNDPFIVVDGLPGITDLSLINPNDIESISVLKDASATAIYGARGANGVIIITTKKGSEGVSNLSFQADYGWQQLNNKLEMLNAQQFALLANEAATNTGSPFRPFQQDQIPNLGVGTDWQDQVYRLAPQQNYQLSYVGGGKDHSLNISANYFRQDGIIIGSDFERYSLRFNGQKNINPSLTIGNNLSVSRINENVVPFIGSNGVTNGALRTPPTIPVFESDGITYTDREFYYAPIPWDNPVAKALEDINTFARDQLLGDLYLEYEIIKGLKIKTVGAINFNVSKNDRFHDPIFGLRTEPRRLASQGYVRGNRYTNTNTINYQTDLGKNPINILLGHEQTYQQNTSQFTEAVNPPSPKLLFYELSAAEAYRVNSGISEISRQSFFTRLNYTLNSKYIFTFNSRLDASSTFGSNNRWGFFPSGAFAWHIIDEPFLENFRTLSNLKLRVSLGQAGNDLAANRFGRIGSNELTQYVLGVDRGVVPGVEVISPGNEDLRWETTTQYNIGLDFGFFKDRIAGEIDFYYKKTTDLLVDRPLPTYTGFSAVPANIGDMENQGLDLSITTRNLDGAFAWTTTGNISINRNKVLRLAEEFGGIDSLVLDSGPNDLQFDPILLQRGQPVGTFIGLITDGLFQSQEEIDGFFSNPSDRRNTRPGDQKYIDKNGDGIIGPEDYVILGNGLPDFTFGLTNNFVYKGFSLSIFVQGSVGNELFNFNRYFTENPRGDVNNTVDVLNRWTPDNTNTNIPRANSNIVNLPSSRFVEDGTYVRLKNVNLSYTVPDRALSKLPISGLTLGFTATNLLTFTNYKGYDPEVNNEVQSASQYSQLNVGLDYGSYPRARLYSFNLKFNVR